MQKVDKLNEGSLPGNTQRPRAENKDGNLSKRKKTRYSIG